MALEQDLLGFVPVAHLFGVLQVGRVAAIEVLEDAVLVLETAVGAHGSIVWVLDCSIGAGLWCRGGRSGGRRGGSTRDGA